MISTEILPVVAWAAAFAVAALVGWLVYRYLVELMLIRHGTSTRGKVISALEMGDGNLGKLFIVSYEFLASSSDGRILTYRGRQLMTFRFRSKDMVAVRYLSKWPRISLIADRTV